MTTRKTDKRFGTGIRRLLWIGIISQLVVVYPLTYLLLGSRDWLFVPYVAVAAALWATIRLKRYRCHKCGRLIGRADASRLGRGEPIVFHCDRCDIEWDTTIKKMWGGY